MWTTEDQNHAEALAEIAEEEQELDTIADECRRIIERGTKPTCPEVRPIIEAWYARPGNGAGGELHSQLDDGNMELSRIQDDDDYSPTANLILGVLRLMSPSQRRRV